MRSADLYTGAAHVRDAFKELQAAWQDAAEHWSDGVSRGFCERHLEPLAPVVKLSLDSTQRMLQLAEQMRREVGE